jgi:hypothetical protein
MTDKEKLEKIKRLADAMYNAAFNITTDASHLKKAMYDYHQFVIQELHKEEPVSNDLEEAANDYAHDLVHDDVFETFIDGALWQKEHLWKDAQGDDLPEIDKEVIALIEAFGHYKVIFAHRVDENAEIHTSIDGKPLVLHPKRHGKGGWNIPDVKFWLDLNLPKTEE